MRQRKIRVLVAEDSQVARMFLVNLLESDPRIGVVGAVADGQAAVDFVAADRPDVVLMDINMPQLGGFEATRRIMEAFPVPIIVCSAVSNTNDVMVTFQAMEAGAVACIEKPVGRERHGFEASAAHLLETVRLMSEVKVVRRSARAAAAAPAPRAPLRAAGPIQLIGIGASTGGPPVLQTIFAALPKDFPVPILVVQHIAHGFLGGMAKWLNDTTSLQVQIGSYGTWPLPGHVYLAPDNLHMGVGPEGAIVLNADEAEDHVRPSAGYLFRTLARQYGPRAVGMLLTGMGRDGARELKAMRDKGAITIAQDRESSVVHGMPGEAIALGGAAHVLPASRMADALIELVGRGNAASRR